MVRSLIENSNNGESYSLVLINTDEGEKPQFVSYRNCEMSLLRAIVILMLFVVAVNCDKYFGIKKKKKPHHHDMLCKLVCLYI